jgi:D-3-phosphoglycerate dehydrogenase
VSSKPAILVTAADLAPQALALLADFNVIYAGKTPDEDAITALCEEHQPVAIIVRYGKIPARAIEASKALRVISKHGTGIDTIDSKAAAARGIAVKAAVGANADAVAEHSWALILACAKNVVGLDARMRAGYWDKATHKSLELKGKTLGVVGIGAIGRRVAELGLAFGMQVLAYDPVAKTAPAGVVLGELDDLLARSHVVSLNCPLTESNRHMVNRESLARMRDGAILVNTGRGGLIDEEALLAALASGKLRAAGLDAFATEPLVGEHAFKSVPNVVLSPHVGGVSQDAYVNMGLAAARNVLDVLSQPPSAAAA